MLQLRTYRRHAVIALALAAVSAGCGAKTGLRVPDVALDAPDVIDVVDVFDAPDVHDAPDIVDVPPVDVFEACVPGVFTLLRRNVDVMFLIDRSGSMLWNIQGQVDVPPSRWSLLQDALGQVLPSLQDSVALGALFFPQPPADQQNPADLCIVPTAADVPPGAHNASAILSVFTNTQPLGGTPTFDALTVAASSLSAAAGRGDARYMVLATDGGPNCNFTLDGDTCTCTYPPDPTICQTANGGANYDCLDDARTVMQMANVFATGIPIFVIGIADEGDPVLAQTLNAMAVAGGRPLMTGPESYYSVRQPADLQAALSAVRDQVAVCAFVTPSRPDDPNDIVLSLNGVPIARDLTRVNGWDWTDVNFGEVTLFGAACASVVADPTAMLTARVGCNDP